MPLIPKLPEGDLLRDATYRRLWLSIVTSSFGNQVMMLALPLTAAVLLQATPTQMGLLTAIELLPFLLFSLPSGVWLDRVRKLPVYVAGESAIAVAAASVPLAWWLGWLTMGWLYVVGFLLGAVHTVAGTAAQVVLTQVVARDRLVEAHARRAGHLGCGGRGPGPRWRADPHLRRAAGAAEMENAVLLLGSGAHPARHPHRRTPRAAPARPLLARSGGGPAFCHRDTAAAHAGRADGRLADVPLRSGDGADPVCHAHAGPERTRGGAVLHGHGRGHHHRQPRRSPWARATRPRPSAAPSRTTACR